jgi:hypothetical protein
MRNVAEISPSAARTVEDARSGPASGTAVSTARSAASRFVVLGCGHTGTTLVAGILHINGYGSFKVSGLFENLELNDLNRHLLADGVDDEAVKDFVAKLERKTGGKWSLKDPRLSETLSAFYRHIRKPVKIIFNFRDPGTTVRSLMKEREMHEKHLTLEESRLSSEEEWLRRNRAALKFLDNDNHSPVLFTRYDDLVDRRLDDALSRFVGHPLDLTFIEPTRRRSSPVAVSAELLDLYAELNRRFEANQREILRTTVAVKLQPRAAERTTWTRQHLFTNRIANGIRRRLPNSLKHRF